MANTLDTLSDLAKTLETSAYNASPKNIVERLEYHSDKVEFLNGIFEFMNDSYHNSTFFEDWIRV
jgi:hypothetical protein